MFHLHTREDWSEDLERQVTPVSNKCFPKKRHSKVILQPGMSYV